MHNLVLELVGLGVAGPPGQTESAEREVYVREGRLTVWGGKGLPSRTETADRDIAWKNLSVPIASLKCACVCASTCACARPVVCVCV